VDGFRARRGGGRARGPGGFFGGVGGGETFLVRDGVDVVELGSEVDEVGDGGQMEVL
jgi:hypothetical protein